MRFEIRRFDSQEMVYQCEADSFVACIQAAVRSGAKLYRTDLSGTHFHYATLDYVDLRGARLCWTNLARTSLYFANLADADLSGACLRFANLDRADLRRARLCGATVDHCSLDRADLSDAILEWHSRDLIAEVLTRAAGENRVRQMLAGLVRVSPDWSWSMFFSLKHPEKEWAMGVLAQHMRQGDNAPYELLRWMEAR